MTERTPAGETPGVALLTELRRWKLVRTLRHQFAFIARRVTPAPLPGGRSAGRTGSSGRWQSHVPAPEHKPGLAAVTWVPRQDETRAEPRRDFRQAGVMSLGELYRHFKRTGQLAVFFAMYPQP